MHIGDRLQEMAEQIKINPRDFDSAKIEINGISMPLSKWAKIGGLKTRVIADRLAEGWDEIDAIFTPFTRRRSEVLNRYISEYGWMNRRTLDQMLNFIYYQKNNKLQEITYDNSTKTITDWAWKVGINPNDLCARIMNPEWSLGEALTTPATEEETRNRKITINNVIGSLDQWSEITSIPVEIVQERLINGWDVNDAMSIPKEEDQS